MLSVLLIIEQSVNKSVWTSCLKASRGIGLSKLNIFRFHQAKRLKEPSRGFDTLKRNESGAGGHRTLVQTGKQYAFYMLILAFIFVRRQDPDHQPEPYSLKLHPRIGTCEDYSRFTCTA